MGKEPDIDWQRAFFLDMAAAARRQAEITGDPGLKALLTRSAADYEAKADRLEQPATPSHQGT